MPYYALFDFSRVKNIWVKVSLGRVKNTGISKPNLYSLKTCRKSLPWSFRLVKNQDDIIHFPYFRAVKNIWVKVALNGVKNLNSSGSNLHSTFSTVSMAEHITFCYTIINRGTEVPMFEFQPFA